MLYADALNRSEVYVEAECYYLDIIRFQALKTAVDENWSNWMRLAYAPSSLTTMVSYTKASTALTPVSKTKPRSMTLGLMTQCNGPQRSSPAGLPATQRMADIAAKASADP